MTDTIIITNEANFEPDVLEAPVALVDFWAPWCGPCKVIAPVFASVAEEYEGKVVFAKLNVDESPGISEKYGVRGIPTLLLFKAGKVLATKVGAMTKTQLIDFLEENL